MEISFKETVDLMKQGKEEGFNKLYSSTYQRVYARAKQCTKTEEDALDVTQIVFIEAVKNIDKLESADATLSWLYEITYRQACKMYRGEREKVETLLTADDEGIFDMAESVDVSTMPELSADQKATAEIIRGIIEELPELQKMTVLSFYYDDMKLEQIADMMDCSVNTVKSRLNYARKYIKDKVEENEKKGGYKLRSVSILTLLWALKMLTGKCTLEAHAAQGVYNAACASIGIKAGAITATGEKIVKANPDVPKGSAVSVATATAGKIGTAKALMIIGAAILGVGGVAGGVFAHNRSQKATLENIQSEENVQRENTMGLAEEGLLELSEQGEADTLSESEEETDDYLDVTIDLDDIISQITINGISLLNMTYEEFASMEDANEFQMEDAGNGYLKSGDNIMVFLYDNLDMMIQYDSESYGNIDMTDLFNFSSVSVETFLNEHADGLYDKVLDKGTVYFNNGQAIFRMFPDNSRQIIIYYDEPSASGWNTFYVDLAADNLTVTAYGFSNSETRWEGQSLAECEKNASDEATGVEVEDVMSVDYSEYICLSLLNETDRSKVVHPQKISDTEYLFTSDFLMGNYAGEYIYIGWPDLLVRCPVQCEKMYLGDYLLLGENGSDAGVGITLMVEYPKDIVIVLSQKKK